MKAIDVAKALLRHQETDRKMHEAIQIYMDATTRRVDALEAQQIRWDWPACPLQSSTPCIGVCRLDEHDVCVGCRRTLDEIAEAGQRLAS